MTYTFSDTEQNPNLCAAPTGAPLYPILFSEEAQVETFSFSRGGGGEDSHICKKQTCLYMAVGKKRYFGFKKKTNNSAA